MTETNLIFTARHKDSCKTTVFLGEIDRVDERELHHLKWFDYRFMSPREATLHFRDEFQKLYRRKYGQNIDTEESLQKFGVSRGEPEANRTEFTSFWRARQFADQLGVSYSVFLEAAFEVLLRAGWARIPYINQMYGKNAERIGTAVSAHWDEHCESRFMFSALPHYQEESFCGLAAQTAHQDWVIEQIKKLHSNHALGRACFILRILPQDRAELTFGARRFEMARASVEGTVPLPHETIAPREMLPSCMMLPGARDTTSPQCSTCRLASFCARTETSVLASVVSTTGVTDPEEHRRRELGAARTRKSRAKAKLAAEAAAA